MNDPLTPPERIAWEDALYDRPHDAKVLVATIARLCAEVERQRERNARLEAVAKAAAILASDVHEYLDDDDCEAPDPSPTFQALVALDHPEAPDRTGEGR